MWENGQRRTKLLYGLSLALMWLLTFQFYIVSPTLGPKIVMLGRMSKDIYTYLMLFLIFMMAYGVFSEAVIGVGEPDLRATFGRVTYV